MTVQRPSQWQLLFEAAMDIMAHCQSANEFTPDWSFGGGTALMLRTDHRESHDIDIFLDDPQMLPFLNSETQGYALSRRPNTYEADGAHVLKLVYGDVGEIDFICCSSIVDTPYKQTEVLGYPVQIETPTEILAKKVYFRGGRFQPRDMFDLAAVAEYYGHEYAVAAVRQCGADRCAIALEAIKRANSPFVSSIISQLMLRKKTRPLITEAQDISLQIIEAALLECRELASESEAAEEGIPVNTG